MIKGVIFDCDGTLVDSEYLCNLAFEIMLEQYGIFTKAEVLLSKFRGEKLANIIETLQASHAVEFEDDFVEKYRAKVDELFCEKLLPNPGVKELLEQIDLPICVASSGPFKKIHRALTVTRLIDFFKEAIYSSYDVGIWKPEPGLFLYAANAMKVKPTDCLVVEDSNLGILAAKNAGMNACLFDPVGNIRVDGVSCYTTIDHMSKVKTIIKPVLDLF
jgi:HAD superfamily hydrolase (TIGR01509 family)